MNGVGQAFFEQDLLSVEFYLQVSEFFIFQTLVKLGFLLLSSIADDCLCCLVDQEQDQVAAVLLMHDLECISSEGLRFLVFIQQKLGTNTDFYVVGANERVQNFLEQSKFNQAVTIVEPSTVLS